MKASCCDSTNLLQGLTTQNLPYVPPGTDTDNFFHVASANSDSCLERSRTVVCGVAEREVSADTALWLFTRMERTIENGRGNRYLPSTCRRSGYRRSERPRNSCLTFTG